MKISPYCAPCMMRRCSTTIGMITKDKKKQMKALNALLKVMAEGFVLDGNPSDLGTEERKIVSLVLESPDPFKEVKLTGIKRAKKCIPYFEPKIPKGEKEEEKEKRMKYLMLLAICANKMELSAPHVKIDIDRLEHEIEGDMKKGFGIDNTCEIIERIKKAKEILFICDNAGEAVFDKMLIDELEKYTKVIVGVCNSPNDDDITFEEAELAGLDGKILIGKGNGFGIMERYTTKEMWKKIREVDLIIAKGMANYETLTEHEFLKGKRALLFKVKCPAVSESCGSPVGENAALIT